MDTETQAPKRFQKGDLVRFAELEGMNTSSHFEWIARHITPVRVIRVKDTTHNAGGQLVTVRIGRWPGGVVLRDWDPAWFKLA